MEDDSATNLKRAYMGTCRRAGILEADDDAGQRFEDLGARRL